MYFLAGNIPTTCPCQNDPQRLPHLLQITDPICINRNHCAEIISEVFSADTLCMVAAPGHPLAANRTVTLADAASCPLLLREPGSAGREIVESLFLSGGIQIAPAWESVSTLALIRAAQNGLGIAILPELLVRDALKSGDLVSLPLPPDILTRSLYLIRHRNKYLSSSAEEFLNLCRMWKF